MASLLVPLAAAGTFNLSNTLGDHMVLQHGPRSAVVWGFGAPGLSIETTLGGKALGGRPAVVGADRIWRQSLPPQEASTKPTSLTFHANDGSNASLRDVLFGDVYLCGGQSNMQASTTPSPLPSTAYALRTSPHISTRRTRWTG